MTRRYRRCRSSARARDERRRGAGRAAHGSPSRRPRGTETAEHSDVAATRKAEGAVRGRSPRPRGTPPCPQRRSTPAWHAQSVLEPSGGWSVAGGWLTARRIA